MKLTPKIQKAINYASRLHIGQTRTGDEGALPYVSHCFSVAWILNEYTEDEDIIVAGLLHDILEDVPGYGYDKMVEDFGSRAAKIVKGVSEDKDPNVQTDEKADWLERKQKYLDNLEKDDYEALMVCVADKIHNLQSMRDVYSVQGEKLWENFNAPSDKKIWFYEEVYRIIKAKLKNEIVGELEKQLKGAKKEFAIAKTGD